MAHKDSIGEKIRVQRVIKGYSQEYMSWVLDVSQGTYSNLEREATKITIKRVYEIAEILEISPFILLPKPKYGLAINLSQFRNTLSKFKNIWTEKVRRRKAEAPSI